MRLIDADALYAEFEKAAWYNNADRDEVAESLLLDTPTIDAVPVVRCGECERRDKCSDLTDTVYCLWYMEQMYKTDFCSYGTREEGSR